MPIVQRNAEPFFFSGGETGCLLVHGFTGSPSEMRPMGQFLADQGHTVLGVRLQGHGTNLEEMAQTGWNEWYRSVEHAYIELAEQCSRVFVIGLSMGGLLALHSALEYPAAGVVAINSPIYLLNHKAIFAPLLRYVLPFSEKKDYHVVEGHFAYDKVPVNCLQSLLNLIRMVKKELPMTCAPLLVLQSEQDEVVNPRSAEFIYQRSGSKDKELQYYANAGHLVTLGAKREEVFRKVLSFIDKQIGNMKD
ncbi:MAG TPA: alpha/beta fold hydrolase [Verrucomicrobiae bacterium]|nr:alpha/beta fold hydrolase [Verrucomicrobiae bacterium]